MEGSGLEIPDKQELSERYEALRPLYEETLEGLHHYLKRELDLRELHATVKTRVKSFASYYQKLLRRMSSAPGAASNDPASAEGEMAPGCALAQPAITDVLGVRIVCPFLEQISIAGELLRARFEVLHCEEKGAEQSFREFGYQSTHYLVRIPEGQRPAGLPSDAICEVQLCTLLQDAWAEVEHELVYKAEFSPFDEPLRRKLAALNANLTLADIIFQEIRDYQRQLNTELQRRRQDFLDSARPPTPGGSRGRGGARPVRNGSAGSLDDLLLEALYAHNARRYPEAIACYSRILAAGPQQNLETIVLVHRGMAHFAHRHYDDALEDFRTAIDRDPRNAKAFYCRAIVYRTMRDHHRALRDLDRCLELSPYEFDALLGRSRVRLELGELEKALEDCENALRIEPADREAIEFKNHLLSIMG